LLTLPATLPGAYTLKPGTTSVTSDVDSGGYDVMIGGHGFRLATDQQFYYSRATEPTTTHRFDSEAEPGEQSLSPLPWIKSQASFHGGAGQLNLEQGLVAFQYEQERIDHIRYDTSVGVDVWTPGQVTRLPDCRFFNFGFTSTCMVTATVGTTDYAIIGGQGNLYQAVWSSGPDASPTVTPIDLSSAVFGGASNCNITSLTTDGLNYYGVVNLTVVGNQAGVQTYVIAGSVSSTAAPTVLYNITGSATAIVGWQKFRLVGGIANSIYELSPTVTAFSTLPAPKYTHPISTWTWTCTAESPSGVLVAGVAGGQASVLEMTLNTSGGGAPFLSGGQNVAKMPQGEVVKAMIDVVGSFLAMSTTNGVRVGTYDTYTGALKLGPLSITTTSPALDLASRDRFVYAGFTNQQADGKTGLVSLDVTTQTDTAGRLAYAPSLRPPTSAPTGLGVVTGVALLPYSRRLLFVTPEGLHVEGGVPGSDGNAWLRTSRIRYATAEPKLFKLGRIHGTLDQGNVQITGIAPYGATSNLGTFGYTNNTDPGEFRLPAGLNEWIQLQFSLQGSGAVVSSYQVKAYPAPARQHVYTLTVNCFRNETDRYGLDVTDPETPRTRFQNLVDLEKIGNEIRYVEFTNSGAVATIALIDQLEFKSFSRPNIDDDFGGYITVRLRTTES
jgi:hypothetical protein